MGKYCSPILQVCLKHKEKNFWLNDFFCALRQAYIIASNDLKKLPHGNETLILLSYLSPGLQRNNSTVAAFPNLAKKLPNILTPSKRGILYEETRAYTVDNALPLMVINEEDSQFRLDRDWWIHVMNRKADGQPKYPVLRKLVKALLCFYWTYCGRQLQYYGWHHRGRDSGRGSQYTTMNPLPCSSHLCHPSEKRLLLQTSPDR